MSKLNLTMSAEEIVLAMSDGVIGAASVCMSVLNAAPGVDPDTHPLMLLLHLDRMEVYGSRLWVLFKYICGRNIATTIGVVRAFQLGIVTKEQVGEAIDHVLANPASEAIKGLDVNQAVAAVKERLPNFNPQYGAETTQV